MNIFVSNLNFKTSSDGLREAFEHFGEVTSTSIMTDRIGRSKGFGFAEMPNDDEAKAAIAALNGSDLEGRTITVKKAIPS